MSKIGHGIRFHFFDNTTSGEVCDICGIMHNPLIQSKPFDNGNASETVISLCQSCVRNLDNIFNG